MLKTATCRSLKQLIPRPQLLCTCLTRNYPAVNHNSKISIKFHTMSRTESGSFKPVEEAQRQDLPG